MDLAEMITSSTSVLKENTFHVRSLDRMHGHLTKNNLYFSLMENITDTKLCVSVLVVT